MNTPTPLFYTVITIASALSGFAAVWGALVYLFRRGLLQTMMGLPDEKRLRTKINLRKSSQTIRVAAIVSSFWMLPIGYLMDRFDGPGLSSVPIFFALLYLNVLESYLYTRWFAKALDPKSGGTQAAA